MRHFTLLFVLFLSAFAQEMTRTKVIMGTFISLTLPAKEKQHIKPAFDIMKAVDKSLSSFKNSSPIYKLNQNKHAKLDTFSFEALRLASKYYRQTDGYFDIAIGSITKDLYRFGADERVPETFMLKESDISFSGLKFNEKEAKISSKIKIDLGGMGKGFAVDKVVKYLQEKDVKKAKIAASGDIRCLGFCTIEVRNPFSEQALVAFSTKEKNIGISTSGNYEHFVKNRKNNHLINPKTKHSQDNFTSITLISALPSSDLDAYATAVSVMPKQKAFEFLKSLDAAFVVLDNEKQLYVSENIYEFVKDLVVNDTFNTVLNKHFIKFREKFTLF